MRWRCGIATDKDAEIPITPFTAKLIYGHGYRLPLSQFFRALKCQCLTHAVFDHRSTGIPEQLLYQEILAQAVPAEKLDGHAGNAEGCFRAQYLDRNGVLKSPGWVSLVVCGYPPARNLERCSETGWALN